MPAATCREPHRLFRGRGPGISASTHRLSRPTGRVSPLREPTSASTIRAAGCEERLAFAASPAALLAPRDCVGQPVEPFAAAAPVVHGCHGCTHRTGHEVDVSLPLGERVGHTLVARPPFRQTRPGRTVSSPRNNPPQGNGEHEVVIPSSIRKVSWTC